MSTAAPFQVSTFYHFAPVSDPQALRGPMLERMRDLGVRGTITFAREGVNATIAGTPDSVAQMLESVRAVAGFAQMQTRDCASATIPFKRSKVKVKRELISIGAPANPAEGVGVYVAPCDWNALIASPDVMTIDTRNRYEFEIGHFAGAVNPDTRHFKQMVEYTAQTLAPRGPKQKIAMYCTGGIRCEKYSAYLKAQGFEEVYHLKGGILAYLDQVPATQSAWKGGCFVFDERESVAHEA